MVGFAGNTENGDITEFANGIRTFPDHDVTTHEFDSAKFTISTHKSDNHIRSKNVNWFVWGYISGKKTKNGYVSRFDTHPRLNKTEYFGELYSHKNLNCFSTLNSQASFCGYNSKKGEVYLVTDRLGTHPIYYSDTQNGLTFSTDIQSLAEYNESEFSYDGLIEFLTLERALGTETVFSDIYKVPPASILTYNVDKNQIDISQYWMPEYQQKNKPYSYFVSQLSQILEDIIQEYNSISSRSGLLLSGGSDSRLIANFMNESAVGYHLNESKNIDAQTAKKVASVSDIEFEFLKRNNDYLMSVLLDSQKGHNYTSWFDQAHATGFRKKITSQVDQLICGQYADTVLGDSYIPLKHITLPLLGWKIDVPVSSPTGNVDSFFKKYTNGEFSRATSVPSYVNGINDISQILRGHSNVNDNSFMFHGVKYKTAFDCPQLLHYFPITNTKTYRFYESLIQMLPTHFPFLDNRVLELALQLPIEYATKRELMYSTVYNVSKPLGLIPHSDTGLPLQRHYYYHYLQKNRLSLHKKLGMESSRGSWPDLNGFIRNNKEIKSMIVENQDWLEQFSFIDSESVLDTYTQHLNGKDNYTDIYPILTLLNSKYNPNRITNN